MRRKFNSYSIKEKRFKINLNLNLVVVYCPTALAGGQDTTLPNNTFYQPSHLTREKYLQITLSTNILILQLLDPLIIYGKSPYIKG
jgi:hypothetical protein